MTRLQKYIQFFFYKIQPFYDDSHQLQQGDQYSCLIHTEQEATQ